MSIMLNAHHVVSEGMYVPFERPTAEKKAALPPSPNPAPRLVCHADKNLERNVAQLLGGTLTYDQLRWNMTADRIQASPDPEEAYLPSKSEVRNEYARTLAHARTCVICLIKHGGEISTNHLKILGILQLPTAIH